MRFAIIQSMPFYRVSNAVTLKFASFYHVITCNSWFSVHVDGQHALRLKLHSHIQRNWHAWLRGCLSLNGDGGKAGRMAIYDMRIVGCVTNKYIYIQKYRYIYSLHVDV